ncbi:hypothetical protein TNIN_401151 [Trichonephila inaurata madagascariensis]|uniref:AF4/FMR2 family member lilli n=1 Tax=Trichonephila inaurata madagascariensis TaxID=2747483 RepID=A0A8X6WPE0_9ARAC|nr:hypothetical protein TNIN_401151 [Trichonephila inaurata madagascariensis]
MLFVNEDFEEAQPVFSEPKKVHPETDDDMVRRIKSMLGEYVHESEFSVNESIECEMKEMEHIPSQSSEIHSNSKSSHQKDLEEGNAEENSVVINEISTDTNECMESVEKSSNDKVVSLNNDEVVEDHIDNCQNVASEEPSANSRRCSLKRQCKERISLLDYNPMFTIRTKRTKGNANKGKSTENLDIPTLKKCPEVQISDNLSEVPNQDLPPLLDAMLTPSCSYSSSSRKESLNDHNINFENFKNESKKREDFRFQSELSTSLQDQIKSKKQPKKKKRKKIMYESLPVPEVSALSANAQDCNGHSLDSKIGSCQIKNGIIKIRLSKLPDSKKDVSENNYEVSFCETDALSACKPLSVPLSPLAPDVYSAYCTTYKKKSHSSCKVKHAAKKKKLSEILPEGENGLVNSSVCVDSVSLNYDKEPDEENFKVSSDDIRNDDFETSETCPEVTREDDNMDSVDKCNKDKVISVSEKDDFFIVEKQINNDIEQLSTLTIENEINTQSSIKSPSVNRLEVHNPKIMCSINLSLINRLPVKAHTSIFTNDQSTNQCSNKEKYIEELIKDSSNIIQNNVADSEIIGNFKKKPGDLKEELLIPLVSNLPEAELNSVEIIHSPNLLQEDSKDGSCPNLTPAYSFEILNTDDGCSKNICENLSGVQETPLFSSSNNITSDDQGDLSLKEDAPIFLHNSHISKVKIEVPDAILSNHERWNEYKEYKWCRDFTDIAYNDGNSLLKEQISYRFWQDPELKKQYSSEYYLNEAKKLKHQADKEIDRMVQAMKYLEAVLYFILTGNAMEHSYIDTDRVHTMYKETLALIRFISSKFQKLHNASCRNIDNKLTVLSLRCQSLLYLKMYQLRRDEVRYLHRNIATFSKSENGSLPDQLSPPHLQLSRQNMKHSQVSPSHQASPCSLTPSPAGSVASVSSQSSGYSSSELGWSSTSVSTNFRAQAQHDMYSDAVTVSRNKYKMLQQQSAYLANLHFCHDLWEHADYLSSKEHSREFFLELDEECGCLSLHSPFSALVHYVRKGLYKLKDGT